VFQHAPQQELDLAVQAAQLVVRPCLQRVEHGGIDTEQERLALGHATSVVEGARVDDWLRAALAAEHHEQVAHHRCLALFVELDDVVAREAIEGHLHHAHRAVDDALARGDDRAGLLTLQHRGRDLGRVGQVADTRFDQQGIFIADKFEVGQTIFVSGTTRNDGRYNVAGVTATTLTLAPGSILAAETVAADLGGASLERTLSKKGGVFRSTDGGNTFAKQVLFDPAFRVVGFGDRLPPSSVTDLVADPGNDQRYYAAVRGGGVYLSTDAGLTWNPVNGAGATALSLATDAFDNDGNRLINDARALAQKAGRAR